MGRRYSHRHHFVKMRIRRFITDPEREGRLDRLRTPTHPTP
ncbi:hypothetical protein [Micromonospora sp.]